MAGENSPDFGNHQPYGPWFHQALEVVHGSRVWGWQLEGRVSLVAMLLWMDVEKAGKVGVGQDLYGKVVIYVHMYIFT